MANSFTKQFPNSFSATQQTHEVLKNIDNETQKIYDVLNALNGTQIANTPTGNISATTVQAAINELDAEKAPKESPTFTGNAIMANGGSWQSTTYLVGTTTVQGQISSSSASLALPFSINGVEKMRIGSNGNVGIGTIAPQSTMHSTGSTILGLAGVSWASIGNMQISPNFDGTCLVFSFKDSAGNQRQISFTAPSAGGNRTI